MQSYGRRKEKEIRDFLAGNAAPEPDGERKQADLALFRERIRELPGRRKKKFWTRLREQAEFVHPVSWAVQLLFALNGIWVAKQCGGETGIMCISSLVPVFAAVGGVEVSKAVHYRMWELERSCRYDTRNIAILKLFLFGMCDLAVLTLFSFLVYGEGGGLLHICQLVLVPFNISTGVYLFVLERFPMRNGNLLLLVLGGMMAGLQIFGWERWKMGPAVLGRAGTGAALVVSLLFLAGMAVRFCREKDREDEILWSLE